MMNVYGRFLLFPAVLMMVSSAWAWGAGHETVGRCILKKLPTEWQARFKPEWQKDYLRATHLPDNGDPKLLKSEELRWFNENCDLKSRTASFHAGPALFGVVERLVHAIRTGDDYSVFIYLATISHAIGDGAATNHDALLHFFGFTWAKENAKPGQGMPVLPNNGRWMACDFNFVEGDANVRAVFERRLVELKIPDPPADLTPERLFALLDRWEILSMECCNQNSEKILQAGAKWYATGDPEAEREAADAMCNLGFWTVKRTLFVFKACCRWAEQPNFSTMPMADKIAINKKAHTNCVDILKRPLANDSFAQRYLPEPGRPSRVRVMYSPVDYGANSVFSACSRPFGCMIVGTLKEKRPELNASILDAREFAKDGLDPNVTPVVVIFRRIFGYRGFDAKGMIANLKKYAAAGGKVIWINGEVPEYLLGADAMKALRDNLLKDGYCQPKYPVSMDELMKSSVAWIGPGEKKAWSYVRKPLNTGGWHWWGSPQWFERSELPKDAVPLVELRTPEKTFLTGIACQSCAYLPFYTIFPYALTDEHPVLSPFVLRLDSAGEAMMIATVNYLLSNCPAR